MSDELDMNGPAYRLATLLKSIEDENERFANLRTDHKERMEALHIEVSQLRHEILTGQKQLPLEPPPEEKPLAVSDGENTISMGIRGEDGKMRYTPPVPLSTFKAAVEEIKHGH